MRVCPAYIVYNSIQNLFKQEKRNSRISITLPPLIITNSKINLSCLTISTFTGGCSEYLGRHTFSLLLFLTAQAIITIWGWVLRRVGVINLDEVSSLEH